MSRIFLSFFLSLVFSAHIATAQQQPDTGQTWIQLESHPSLAVTQQAIRAYGAQIEDVNGFSLGAGWYAVALGPYGPEEAEEVLARLRNDGLIPRDSYVAISDNYLQQFWPVGANYLSQPAIETQTAEGDAEPNVQVAQAQTGTQSDAGPQVVEEESLPLVDEGPAEARQNEALLSTEERAELQRLLEWAGYYRGAIDAAFGPGTRAAMRGWQQDNGYDPTGIMTTRQRAELFRQFNAVLEGLDIRLVRDDESGIQMNLPMGAVTFEKYEPPFAHFRSTGFVEEARVLFISQPGDRNTLLGLYDIMQTLEIVPEEGERGIEGDSFRLEGRNSRFVSYTQASLENGQVKGFTLIWPAGDEERRARLLSAMRGSFQRLPGVLSPSAGGEAEQRVDLVSGLEIRRPKLSRSGFYVDAAGTVVTTTEAVTGCGRVTIDEDYDARVVTSDAALGVAVLKPVDPLAPLAVAAFQAVPPRLQSDVAVAGYSYGGILGAPTLTFGQLADVRGLNGEEELKRLALNALEGDAGGPVVDGYGAVVGMLLPHTQGGRQLPEGVSFAVDAEALTGILSGAGVLPQAATYAQPLPPETLAKTASGMTVLVSCWE
ncbi:MAG: serine protease [Roseovarius sp.]